MTSGSTYWRALVGTLRDPVRLRATVTVSSQDVRRRGQYCVRRQRRRAPFAKAVGRSKIRAHAAGANGASPPLKSALQRLVHDLGAATLAALAGLGEGLGQALADVLARHLHEAELGDL